MKKNFALKMAIPLVIMLIVLWYQLVYNATKTQIADYNTRQAEVENETMVEQAKRAKMQSMLQELDELKNKEAVTEIALYDNQQNVMDSLNSILAASNHYELNFSVPTIDEETGLYRRVVDMSFSTSDLDTADKIIREIYSSPYRCVIGTITLGADDTTGDNNGEISLAEDGNTVSMQVTYYEIAQE